MIKPHRQQPLWYAYLLHRLSGVALAAFLPVHFYVLGMSLHETNDLDTILQWTELPVVKLAEFGLVFLLAAHLFGGLRLLALEFLPWRDDQKTLAAFSLALAFLLSISFLLNILEL